MIVSTDLDTPSYDVVIVGAGVSGLNALHRIKNLMHGYSFVLYEARDQMGGTWDLMKYPGLRSDSDLHTFGFPWRPWTEGVPIATGPAIKKYMQDCTREHDLDQHIHFQHRLKTATWLSRDQKWHLIFDNNGQLLNVDARFVVLGTGYYDYSAPIEFTIPGLDSFGGKVLHPQFWPEDYDYSGKKIAVIGSGATAITLIPSLAKTAAQVTMVQRSPSYVIAIPNRNAPKAWWERVLPEWLQHRVTRWRYLVRGFFWFRWVRKNPQIIKGYLKMATTAQLPPTIPYDPHFMPSYNPWDQRMCLSPNGDFFEALRGGNCDVATGIIRTVTKDGIELESGQKVEADIIVTATGLKMQYGGNAEYYVDGEKIEFGRKYLWRGAMVQDVPNASLVVGYANASWTLGAETTAQLIVRILKHLDKNNMSSATPRINDYSVLTPDTAYTMTSTYLKHAHANYRLPRTSDYGPWRQREGYFMDMFKIKFGSLHSGMQFTMRTT